MRGGNLDVDMAGYVLPAKKHCPLDDISQKQSFPGFESNNEKL